MDLDTKKCRICEADKPIAEYRLIQGRWLNSYCHDCMRDYRLAWERSEHGKQLIRAKSRRRYARNPEAGKAHAQRHREKVWDKILSIYGAVCRCCGTMERAFLTVDHVNDNGAADRKSHGGNTQLRNWLANQPKLPDYQVLCWNCQWGKRINKVCPHTVAKHAHLHLVI